MNKSLIIQSENKLKFPNWKWGIPFIDHIHNIRMLVVHQFWSINKKIIKYFGVKQKIFSVGEGIIDKNAQEPHPASFWGSAYKSQVGATL